MSIRSLTLFLAALLFCPHLAASPGPFIGTLPELLWPLVVGALIVELFWLLNRMLNLADARSKRVEELMTRSLDLLNEKADKYLELMENQPAAPSIAPTPAPRREAPAPVHPATSSVPTAAPKAAPQPAAASAPAAASTSASVGEQGGVDKAIALIEAREENFPGNLNQAVAILEMELKGKDKGRAYTYLSEATFWLGEYASTKKDKEKYHAQGVEFGKHAVEHDAKNVASHLWYAANMGSHALVVGITSSMFYLTPIFEHGTKALELDEHFFHGAPLRLMGRFYHDCPAWPIGKGDKNKAMAMLERAVKSGPNFLLNHLYLAETYMAKRKKREAKQLIEDVLSRSDIKEFPLYQKQVQDQAAALLKKL